MNKRVFIIHRWDGDPEVDWYLWLRKELEEENFEVLIPEMPNPEEPEIDSWVSELSGIVGKPDEDTYFVGHSVGCQTILRYLENIDTKVGGVVCVAPWFDLKNLEDKESEKIAKPWLETPINFEKVKKVGNRFVAILSDNDPWVPLNKTKKKFKENLGAKVIIEHSKGHFMENDGITELPNVLKAILEILK